MARLSIGRVVTVMAVASVLVGTSGCFCDGNYSERLVVKASALEMEAGGSITFSAVRGYSTRVAGEGSDGAWKENVQRSTPASVTWTVTPSAGAGAGECSPAQGETTTFTSEDPGEYKVTGTYEGRLTDYLYVKVVASSYLLNIGNGLVVTGGGTSPSFTIDAPHLITEMYSYNYGEGQGSPGAGTLALRAADGTVYGPWQCTADEGQGGVPNALWFAYPDAQIPAGTYTVVNSDPATWSQNEQSGGLGFCYVKGTPVEE